MTDADQRPAVVGQVERPVRPRAWEYVDRKGWVQALFAAEPHDLYPCKPLYDQAALDAALAAERAESARLRHLLNLARDDYNTAAQRLQDIGDYAHDHSTGPAVPDALWEVRSMAYGSGA